MKKIILSLALLSVTLCLSAQQTAADFLTATPDAQALSMGGASVATEATAYSFWNNPAAASFSEKKLSAGVSYGLMQPNLSKANMAAVSGYGRLTEKLTIEAAGKFYMHKPFDKMDQNGAYEGTYTPSEYTFGVGVAYRILPYLSAAVGANYIGSDIGGPKSAVAFSANLGVYLKLKAFTAGFRAANIGTSLNYGGEASYGLPMDLSLGAAYKLGKPEKHNLDITAQASMLPANGAFLAAAGLRYNYADYFHLAAGYSFAADKDAPSYLTVGTGVEFIGINLDLCYVIGSAISNTLMINLGYAF